MIVEAYLWSKKIKNIYKSYKKHNRMSKLLISNCKQKSSNY